jgi:hypothetical protein
MLDKRRTMKVFKQRLRDLDARLFKRWFDEKWVSSFDLRSTIPYGQPIGPRIRKHYSAQAYLIAVEKGAKPLGITTEHTHGGNYICSVRRAITDDNIRYIGKYSHFSGHKLKREDNPFALQPADKRYGKKDDRHVVLVYNLRSVSSLQSST